MNWTDDDYFYDTPDELAQDDYIRSLENCREHNLSYCYNSCDEDIRLCPRLKKLVEEALEDEEDEDFELAMLIDEEIL